MISPDGTAVVMRYKDSGISYLIAYPFAKKAEAEKRIGLGKLPIQSVTWAGPNRLLLAVSNTVQQYDVDFPVMRLVLVDLTTMAVTPLDQRNGWMLGGQVLSVDPAGRWALVTSHKDLFSTPSVKRFDLVTNEVSVVERARPNLWNWFADEHGTVRAGVSYSGDRWTVWYRDTPGEELKPIRGRFAKDDEGAVDGLRFLGKSGRAIIVTNSKTGRFGAYTFDTKTGAIGTPIYEHPYVDIDGILTNDAGEITGFSYEDERARVHWLDPVMKKVQADLDKALPDASNVVVSHSDDLNRMLVWSGTASDPGLYYLYDRKAKALEDFAARYDRADVPVFSAVKAISYTSRDGLTIRGYLTLPKDRPERGLPLIVMPHGGPFVRDTWDFDPYVQFLASRGYAVLQPNFRGSTGYGKDFVERGYGQWGQAMQDDIDDGVDWVVKEGMVDARRVCIMGASYGGYAALWGAIRNPERYRCAVSLAGVTDLPGMLKYDRRAFSAPRYYREWERRVQGETKRDLTAVSPLAQAARLKRPVFIAHGENDANVPAKQGHEMVTALKKAGVPVTSVFYPGEGHGLDKAENKVDFFKRIEAFLNEHNPATPKS